MNLETAVDHSHPSVRPHMNTSAACLLLLVASFLVGCSQTPLSPNDRERGLVKLLDGGEFVEVERSDEYSIVEVRSSPSGSAPSAMYALRGACSVARVRGEQYVSSQPHSGSVRTYRLLFPKTPTEAQLRGSAKSVFSMADCAALRF